MKSRLNNTVYGVGLPTLLTTAALLGFGVYALARGRRTQSRVPKVRPDMPSLAGGRGLRVERTVTVMRSPEELYARWRNLSRLPELMPHLESVIPTDETHSHWVARGPGDLLVAWTAEIVADEPGRLIAWRSEADSDVDTAGSVRFTPMPSDRGTEVKVLMSYAPPAGRLADVVATLFGRGGDREVRESLRRFKQQMEADEVATAAPNRQDGGASVRERRLGAS
jgi:uncharacterized membrane protein